jgi:hypothetical protein
MRMGTGIAIVFLRADTLIFFPAHAPVKRWRRFVVFVLTRCHVLGDARLSFEPALVFALV